MLFYVVGPRRTLGDAVRSLINRMFPWRRLPSCLGEFSCTLDGNEYDCLSIHGEACEDCLANYYQTGGRFDPETGRKLSRLEAFVRFGRRSSWSKK